MKQTGIKIFIVLVLLAGFVTGNAGGQSFPPVPYEPVTTIRSISRSRYQTTVNDYTFTARDGRTIKLFYSFPVNVTSDTQLLFVMHGVGRNAEGYINTYQYLPETENIIVIVPEFALEQFPSEDYQRIGISANINAPENWMPKIIDDIFLNFTRRFNLRISKYILFGHSAGAQFTHRSVMFSESNYMDYAIAANAGSYTFVNMQDVNFRWGVKDVLPRHRDLINRNFGRRLYILIGDKDNDPNAADFTRSATADRQGITRYERALNFYQVSRDYCTQNNLPFNWELIVMGGVAHSSSNSRPYVIDIITGKYKH